MNYDLDKAIKSWIAADKKWLEYDTILYALVFTKTAHEMGRQLTGIQQEEPETQKVKYVVAGDFGSRLVEYDTAEEAQNAVKILRNHGFNAVFIADFR